MQTLKHNGFDVSQPWVLWITADIFLALHFKYVLEGITDLKEGKKKSKKKRHAVKIESLGIESSKQLSTQMYPMLAETNCKVCKTCSLICIKYNRYCYRGFITLSLFPMSGYRFWNWKYTIMQMEIILKYISVLTKWNEISNLLHMLMQHFSLYSTMVTCIYIVLKGKNSISLYLSLPQKTRLFNYFSISLTLSLHFWIVTTASLSLLSKSLSLSLSLSLSFTPLSMSFDGPCFFLGVQN